MSWIELSGTPWNDAWVRSSAAARFNLFPGDGLGVQWLHLETGTRIALVGDGGWEMMKHGQSYRSRFRIIRFDPLNGLLTELTTELLGHPFAAAFNPQLQGTFRYSWILERCVALMRGVLDDPIDLVAFRAVCFEH